MPTPSRNYPPHTSPNNGRSTSLLSPSAAARQQRQQQRNMTNNKSTVGKRTGVTLPPRGQIPLDDEGLEDADAFFAAAKSPTSPAATTTTASPGSSGGSRRAYGKRANGNAKRERQRLEEKRRLREELEEEGRMNVERGPDILNRNDEVYSEEEEEDDGGEGGKQRATSKAKSRSSSSSISSFQPTPKQPGWSNRLLHQAMGVLPTPTESSPSAYTVLSRVSTAAPSTRGSVDTIATMESTRHGLRERQNNDAQLENLLATSNTEELNSPAMARADPDEGGVEEEEKEAEEEEEELEVVGGPMDPPEEMSQESGREVGERRGLDPVEREHLLEPEDAEEGNGDDDGISAKASAKSAGDNASEKSVRSATSAATLDDASEKPSAKSAASIATDPLEQSLEEVVVQNSNYNLDYSDDDEGRDGGMQLATQGSEEGGEDVDFGAGNVGGDFGGEYAGFYNDGMDVNDDAVSRQASLVSEKSRKSNHSYKSDKSEVSDKSRKSSKSYKSDKSEFSRKSQASTNNSEESRASSERPPSSDEEEEEKSRKSNHSYKSEVSDKSRKSSKSYKSDKSEFSRKSQESSNNSEENRASERPPSSDEEENEKSYNDTEESPQKKQAKRGRPRKDAPPVSTPTSVLHNKKSKKEKKQQAIHKKRPTANKRVNWSTPTGNARGIAVGNRGFEAIPVSDYKDEYPSGEEPKTPGGSNLRRGRRARFKPLHFWKNEKLIYEAQNEKGLLGEAMGDMPVVSGVMHALPTPYKEKKKGGFPKKKTSDEGSDDDDAKRSRAPYDDKKLRKKHRIHNGESGSVWSETLESATDVKIVSRLENRSFSKLPLSSARRSRESKVVGFASQAFHVPTDSDDLFPGYIAGNVVLPPRGIKDAEGVGLCSQVFNVGDCQENSVEFAIADPGGQDGEFDPRSAQRYLLGKGDMFQIPPGNVYRIENHSKTEKATLFWTIIKCTSRAEQEDSGDENEED